MRITLNKLNEQIENVNRYLQEQCINNIKVQFYKPDYFPGVILLKNGVKMPDYDARYFCDTKTEIHISLTRVIKFLWTRDEARTKETGEKRYHYITDKEICGIFAAAFWR